MYSNTKNLIFAFISVLTSCNAQTISSCVSSSCGNIRDISFPFRLRGTPSSCGRPEFELQCRNNQPTLTLGSGRYIVESITYSNFSIRLLDPGLQNPANSCSPFPIYRTNYIPVRAFDNLFDNLRIVYVTCLSPISSPRFVSTSFCNATSRNDWFLNSSRLHNYVIVLDNTMVMQDLEDTCSFETMAWVAPRGPVADNTSLTSIHSGLAYGFELSWIRHLCGPCESSNGVCSVEGNTIACRRYCYEDVPLYRLSLRCQFKYWGFIVGIFAAIAVGGLLALRFLCGFPFLLGLVIYKWRRIRHLSRYETIEDFLQGQNNLTPINYSYSDIRRMTNNFKEKLGEGGYGTVFKGKLRSGSYVAVKIVEKSTASGEEFVNEVAIIGRIHHMNVVQLIGFCMEGSKRALVYEFMHNGSLDRFIFQERVGSLSYKQMFEISLGVARGIDYLHRGCDMQILHFDIKPHNILLDEKFNPKISDFGLARLYPADGSTVPLTAARGTMGYMAPELFYKNIGGVSFKADVYSFGMLLMELAGRRKNMNPFAGHLSQIYFPTWVYDRLSEGKDIDLGQATTEEKTMIKKLITAALWCIQMKPVDRPSMNQVVEMLEGDAELLHMPPRPFLCPREMVEDHGLSTSPREA